MSAQLFIGRLSKSTRQREVEDIFSYYGHMTRCELKFGSGMAYAFVDYADRRDAEDAIKYENGKEVHGQSIVVEWARGPKRGFEDDECYRCGRRGHFARDCRDRGGRVPVPAYRSYGFSRSYRSSSRERYRSRSRSRDRNRRRSMSRSRSPDKGRRRSRSRSRSRSHSPRRRSDGYGRKSDDRYSSGKTNGHDASP